MKFVHAQLIHRFAAATFIAALVVAFGAIQSAPAHSTGPLAAADLPAPDAGDDSADPTEEPEPTPEPTTAPTQSAAPATGTDDSTVRSDDNADANDSDTSGDRDSTSGDDSNDSSPGVGPMVGPTDSADGSGSSTDETPAEADTVKPAESGWSSSLGWVLLVGGLASATGAFVVYRRDPGVLAWPWLHGAQ